MLCNTKIYGEGFDGAPFGVATMAGTLTLPGETNNTVVLDALGHHGTESIARELHYLPFPPPSGHMCPKAAIGRILAGVYSWFILFRTLGVAVLIPAVNTSPSVYSSSIIWHRSFLLKDKSPCNPGAAQPYLPGGGTTVYRPTGR